jgi:hypothetical protein
MFQQNRRRHIPLNDFFKTNKKAGEKGWLWVKSSVSEQTNKTNLMKKMKIDNINENYINIRY